MYKRKVASVFVKKGKMFRKAPSADAAMAALSFMRRNRAPVRGAIRASRQELKYSDIAATTYVADTTGTVTALNLLAAGDDNTNRDGRQVTIKSVQIRGVVRPFDTSTVNWTKARMLLVWDNANNSSATIATVAQILTAANSKSFPLINNANRFTILCDKSFMLGPINDGATVSYASNGSGGFNVEIYKRINQVTQYSLTTAVIEGIQNGVLLMVTIGDSAPGAAGIFDVATRVRFQDD